MSKGAEQVEVLLFSGKQKQCADTVRTSLDLKSPVNKVAVPLTQECRDPEVRVVLKDASGQIVTEAHSRIKSTPLQPESEERTFWSKWRIDKLYILIAFLPILAFILFRYTSKWRSKKMIQLLFLGAILFVGILGTGNHVKADVYYFSMSPMLGNDCYFTANISGNYTDIGGGLVVDVYNGSCSPYNGPGAGAHHYNRFDLDYGADDLSAGDIYLGVVYGGWGSSMPVNIPNNPSWIGTHSVDFRVCAYYDDPHIGNVCTDVSLPFNVGAPGACGVTSGTCSVGTPTSYVTGSDQDTWTCVGVNGGSSHTTCISNHPASCGSANGTYTTPSYDYSPPSGTELCWSGTASIPTRTPDTPGNDWSWNCSMSYPVQDCSWVGSAWTCTPSSDIRSCGTYTGGGGGSGGPENGQCGPAAKTYASTDTAWAGAICNIGTATPNPTFPVVGNSVNWVCDGVSGGSPSSTCTATRNSGGGPTPAPTINFTINGTMLPLSLTQGDLETMNWSTTNATSCIASSNDGWSGSKPTSGTSSQNANVTSSFTLECSGPGGSTASTIQVNVSCTPSTGAWGACDCPTETKSRSNTNAACLSWTDTASCTVVEKKSCRNFNFIEVAP